MILVVSKLHWMHYFSNNPSNMRHSPDWVAPIDTLLQWEGREKGILHLQFHSEKCLNLNVAFVREFTGTKQIFTLIQSFACKEWQIAFIDGDNGNWRVHISLTSNNLSFIVFVVGFCLLFWFFFFFSLFCYC